MDARAKEKTNISSPDYFRVARPVLLPPAFPPPTAERQVHQIAQLLAEGKSSKVFAGISLEGTTLRPDGEANKSLYGKNVSASEIIQESKVSEPESAHMHMLETTLQEPRLT